MKRIALEAVIVYGLSFIEDSDGGIGERRLWLCLCYKKATSIGSHADGIIF